MPEGDKRQSPEELGEELRKTLRAFDELRRSAAQGSTDANPLTRALAEAVDQALDRDSAHVSASLDRILTELAAHNSPLAVKILGEAFSAKWRELSLCVLRKLATMTVPDARNAIARRASWLSFATPEEKKLARAILNRKKT